MYGHAIDENSTRLSYRRLIALFLILYVGSLALLVIARRREGRSLVDAALGFGRPSASPKGKEEPAWVVQLERIGAEQRDRELEREQGQGGVGERRPSMRKRDSWSGTASGGLNGHAGPTL